MFYRENPGGISEWMPKKIGRNYRKMPGRICVEVFAGITWENFEGISRGITGAKTLMEFL